MDEAKNDQSLLLNEYHIALKFFKEKEGSAVHLSYNEKLHLIALNRQASFGKYTKDKFPESGIFDIIGRDRRLAWQDLGDMTREEAMEKFIGEMDSRCPHFKAFVLAQKIVMEERNKKSDEGMESAEGLKKEAKRQKEKELLRKKDGSRRNIRDALNQQTYGEFREYAEKKFPGNPDQQAVFIRELQEQHYHQYMLQVHRKSENQSQASCEEPSPSRKNSHGSSNSEEEKKKETSDDYEDYQIIVDGENTISTLKHFYPATMWTRKNIQLFKNQVRSEGGKTIVKIRHGETVTIRVPTQEGVTGIFYEFATDSFDIGFGVFFEWQKALTNEVTVHITDSDEDEDSEDDDQGGVCQGDDEENPSVKSDDSNPPVSVIIPIFRRDSFEEIYVGSHIFPGEGVYLFKFDNSYSLWRSKTLYYRIYYHR